MHVHFGRQLTQRQGESPYLSPRSELGHSFPRDEPRRDGVAIGSIPSSETYRRGRTTRLWAL